MPYYLHRPGVTEAELSPSAVASASRPDPSPYTSGHCDCKECATKFERLTRELADWERTQTEGEAVRVLAKFPTAAAAHAAKAALHSPEALVITFKPTAYERSQWRDRENSRRGIDRLPWQDEPWQTTLNRLHHAYISVAKPGLIAYTPSEEFGHNNRQLAVRPGRYLEQFAATETGGYFLHLTGADPFTGEVLQDGKEAQRIKAERGSHLWVVTFQRDAYCAMVKALDDRNVVRFAATADDIEAVYRAGPSSCMSHAPGDYCSAEHPVRVYGDSDLQCAYLGTLAPRREVRARAMVWPAEKVYSRVYGDDTLRILLERDGYKTCKPGESDRGGDYGNLGGARIRAVCHNRSEDVWVMPYVDAASVAVLTADRKWFVLGSPGQYQPAHFSPTCERTYNTRNQNGLTNGSYGEEDEDPESYSCAHCGDNEVDEDGGICGSCEDIRFRCTSCRRTVYESDPAYLEGDSDLPVCESCVGNDRVATCDECHDHFLESRYSADSQRLRAAQNLLDYCESCGDDCLTNLVNDCHADALVWLKAERLAESKLVKARAKGSLLRAHSLDTPMVVPPPAAAPDRSTIKILSWDGSSTVADVRARYGAFVVHAPVLDLAGRRGWVVTHEPSTKRACRVKNLADAESLSRELMALGDWATLVPAFPNIGRAGEIIGRYAVSARELD